MKGKTLLFVTNPLQVLRSCVALGEVRAIEQGIFSELDATEGGSGQAFAKKGQTGVRKKLLQNDAEVGKEGSGQREKEANESGSAKPSGKDERFSSPKKSSTNWSCFFRRARPCTTFSWSIGNV
jgi:hypothetical protein